MTSHSVSATIPRNREPIQSLWIGDSLSAVERLCVDSFLANGHPFHLYAYADLGNVPSGATICDAREILPEEKIFRVRRGDKRHVGALGIFADWFRWKLLLVRGGWWADMDMVCLRPLDFPNEIVFGEEAGRGAVIGIMRFPAGHQVLSDITARCERPYSPSPWSPPMERWRMLVRRLRYGNRPDATTFGQIGAPLLRMAVAHHGLQRFACPPQYFYPVPSDKWRDIFDGTLKGGMSGLDEAYCLHLWNEGMRYSHFDKNGKFPADSVFEILRSRYAPVGD